MFPAAIKAKLVAVYSFKEQLMDIWTLFSLL